MLNECQLLQNQKMFSLVLSNIIQALMGNPSQVRTQRFSSTLYYKSTNTLAVFAQSPLVYKYQQQNQGKDFGRLAIDGIISYGKKHNLEQQSQQLANILEKAVATQNPKIIGECVVKLYTMESFLYKDINKFLNNAEFESVGSANVISARSNFKGTVYRGCNLTDEHIKQYQRNIGQCRQWNGFSSTTKNRQKAEKFGNTLFAIKLGEYKDSWGGDCGLEIDRISAYPAEEEVLIWAGMQIRVDKVEREYGRWVITICCVEMGP